MPPPDHMLHYHRSEASTKWQFSYLDWMKEFEDLLAIENISSRVEVVNFSAT